MTAMTNVKTIHYVPDVNEDRNLTKSGLSGNVQFRVRLAGTLSDLGERGGDFAAVTSPVWGNITLFKRPHSSSLLVLGSDPGLNSFWHSELRGSYSSLKI
jgi:hypothetical protein